MTLHLQELDRPIPDLTGKSHVVQSFVLGSLQLKRETIVHSADSLLRKLAGGIMTRDLRVGCIQVPSCNHSRLGPRAYLLHPKLALAVEQLVLRRQSQACSVRMHIFILVLVPVLPVSRILSVAGIMSRQRDRLKEQSARGRPLT